MSSQPGIKKIGWTELRRSIEGGNAGPIYLFTGILSDPGRRERGEWAESRSRPEPYLQREALQLIREKLVDVAFSDFNYVELSAVDHSLDRIALSASQLPAFATRRIVVVKDLDRRFKPRRSSTHEGGQPGSTVLENQGEMDEPDETTGQQFEGIIEYLKNPSDATTLIFVWDRPDRKLRFTNVLLEAATVVEFPRLSDSEAMRWARDYLKGHDCTIDQATLQLLLGRVGRDLYILQNELDKLIDNVGHGPIAPNDVESLSTRLREHFNFELTDQIAARNTERALRLARRRLKDGEAPLLMLGSIAAYYRRSITAKELLAAGESPERVIAAARVAAFKSSQYLQQLRKTPIEELLAALKRIAEVDDAIKSSRATPALQLEMLVYRLCNPSLLT